MKKCKTCNQEAGSTKHITDKYEVPFACETCGNVYIPFEPTHDFAVVWRCKGDEVVYGSGLLVVPDAFAEEEPPSHGIVLAVGQGYDDGHSFYPVEVSIGDRVEYPADAPWFITLDLGNGSETLPFMPAANFTFVHLEKK